MSLVGARTAVVSLGMSCQAAYQIRLHAGLISSSLSNPETLEALRLPFDWLICPPSSARGILDAGTFFPERRDALDIDHAPYWRSRHTYFWHDFLGENGRYDLTLDFECTREKYERYADRFRDLSRLQRLVFVISNTQNNLDFVADRTSALTPSMAAAEIESLCDAADRFFDRSCEYLVVTYPDRLDRDPVRDNVAVHRLARDETEWRGDPGEWARVFTAYFGRRPD